MNIFAATRAIAKLTAQFKAAGLNIEEFIAADESALQAHLDTLKVSVVDPKAAESLQKATLALSAYTTALTKFGAKVADPKEGESLAGNIEAALTARSSVIASEQLSKHGFVDGKGLPVAPAADATKPKSKGQTMTISEWKALGTVERAEFFRKGGTLDSDV